MGAGGKGEDVDWCMGLLCSCISWLIKKITTLDV